MNTLTAATAARPPFELCFQSLYRTGHRLVFPCDGQGHVDLDALGQRALNNYLYARTLIGREFSWPAVVAVH